MTEPARYIRDLGSGLFLTAYSVDPSISASKLVEIVSGKDRTSKFDLDALSKDVAFKGRIDSFSGLNVSATREQYQVPEQLQAYREALQSKLDSEGKFNGPVAVIKGGLEKDLSLCRGGYYDFMATKLEVVPGNLVPDQYLAGQTVEELMPQWEMSNDQRARYFALAFVMLPSDGREFSFVQRAPGLGIAPDCISTTGSTPGFNEGFFESGFDFARYYEAEITKEMGEEYGLNPDEFRITGANLIDDIRTVPHTAVEITTPLTTQELATRIHGKKEAIAEHPVIYSIKPEAIPIFLERFDVWPSVQFVMSKFHEQRR
ncbi:hypothetical protein ACFL0X_01175 [Nanoarchaeota archaeon]